MKSTGKGGKLGGKSAVDRTPMQRRHSWHIQDITCKGQRE